MALSCMVWFSPLPFSFSALQLVEVAAVPLVWEVGHLGAFVLVDLFWRNPFQASAIYRPDPCHPPP